MVQTQLPTCAALAASYREVFGDVRLAFASENGYTIGQRSPDGVKLGETQVGPMSHPRKESRR